MASILPEIVFNAEGDEEAKYRAVVDLRDSLEARLQEIALITEINNTTTVMSVAYDQTEVQQLSDNIKIVSDKLDLVLKKLK